MDKLRIVVVGTMACDPYAGMAWMNMQLTEGFRRLGHDVHYFEISSTWPYDPIRQMRVADGDYAVSYLGRVAELFGLENRWAYRRSYSDKQWFGLEGPLAEQRLSKADLVLNVTGTSRFAEENLEAGRLVYYGTDPVWHELTYANGHPETLRMVAEHAEAVTFGENIGTPLCPIPSLPGLRARTRPPVLVDKWSGGAPSRREFTTVGNWRQDGRDIEFRGETYRWSKHHELLRYIDLPRRASVPLELATNLADPQTIRHGPEDVVKTMGLEDDAYTSLVAHGWKLVDGPAFSTDPLRYRDYIRDSRAEFTVARDLNVRLKSGWFSERSACYLAAGRPVITQDTGFGSVLPLGEGLFAFNTMDEILAAIDAIDSDYERHSRAAREIAMEYFQAEKVLARLLSDLGF